ncbi:lipopolysaccharide assembly protein LapB [Komagataeibacter sp. FNDCR2]|uniref:tetratricopeptide repeat protein n=1 Tax=Komagataeibacter sp. FNDCR2 TaxID=2878682 RepID=UPI001E5AE25E|nr:tetratricopeptide repeat protein [Komagataeibacter sp. FNDCR2]MCE2576420.1 tetratricopeptide repeat protein [Komagataeibacter sp. FNDCR2]
MGESRDRAATLARGYAALGAGDAVGARACFASMRAVDAADPDALHGLACVALAAGRPDLAISLAGRALRHAPGGHYHVVLARALLARGHGDAARVAIKRAIVSQPGNVSVVLAWAEIMERTGDTLAAARGFARAVRLSGRHDGVSRALHARFLWRRGRRATAVEQMRQAVQHAPDTGSYAHELVDMLRASGREAEAEAVLRARLDHAPDDGMALSLLGTLLFARGEMGPAAGLLQRAMTGHACVETCNNLGLARMALGDMAGAEAALRQARHMRPADARITLNHLTGLFESGRHAQARTGYEAMLARNPPPDAATLARARFNLGVVRLAQGELASGWALWESRLAFLPPHPCAAVLPRWDGRALPAGGRLLVHMAQGLGDAIHFLRYVLLAARRVPVVLEVPPALRRLALTLGGAMRETCHPIEIITPDINNHRYACSQCDLFSLPHVLGMTEVPDFAPYLGTHAWRPGGGRTGKLRVGLCHAGNPAYRFDARRSIPMAALAPLAAVKDVTFISLRPQARAEAEPGFVRRECASGGDLLDTARLVATLDLVISVDTLAAHLAGAMGCPVWLLNRFGGDWRWSPAFDAPAPLQPRPDIGAAAMAGHFGNRWYPGLRQFRQHRLAPPEQAWSEVMEETCAALRTLVAGRNGGPS